MKTISIKKFTWLLFNSDLILSNGIKIDKPFTASDSAVMVDWFVCKSDHTYVINDDNSIDVCIGTVKLFNIEFFKYEKMPIDKWKWLLE